MGIKKNKNKYKADEVEAIVSNMKKEYDSSLQGQKDRIFELKSRLTELESELEEYRSREKHIATALTLAVQKAVEIEEASRKKYDLEIEHIRIFHEKWKSYYNQMIKQYPIDDKLSEIKEFDRQMTRVFAGKLDDDKDISAQDKAFEKEKRRVASAGKKRINTALDAEPEERYESIIKAAGKKKPAKAKEEMAFYAQESEEFIPPKKIVNFLEKEEEAEKAEAAIKQLGRVTAKNAIGGKIYDKPIPPSESGFSFEEALNPTEDLEDIMKDLGLSFEGDLDS